MGFSDTRSHCSCLTIAIDSLEPKNSFITNRIHKYPRQKHRFVPTLIPFMLSLNFLQKIKIHVTFASQTAQTDATCFSFSFFLTNVQEDFQIQPLNREAFDSKDLSSTDQLTTPTCRKSIQRCSTKQHVLLFIDFSATFKSVEDVQ